MKVTGLDLSLTGSGVCFADGSTALLRPPKTAAVGMARLAWIVETIWEDAIGLPGSMSEVDLVVIEGYAMGSARQSMSYAIGELGGVVRFHLWERSVPYVDIPPAALKKFATNKGNAGKDEVLSAAVRAGFEGSTNDEADAFWLRQMGLYRFGDPTVSLTAYRADVIDKLVWPEMAVPA